MRGKCVNQTEIDWTSGPENQKTLQRSKWTNQSLSPITEHLLTWRRVGRPRPLARRAPPPPAEDTPPPRRRGTAAPACCGFDSLGASWRRRRSWSRAPTAPSRSAGSLWAGRRTGRSAAAPAGCRGCEGAQKKREELRELASTGS